MLFDTHTNLMWYPDHLSDEFVEFAWAAKRAKMKLSPDVYFAGDDTPRANAFNSRPEQLLDECVVLIRKHPNLYTNISALHYRPLRHYQALLTAIEYGVEHKLIFGSDFPSATPAQVIAGQHKVNDVVRGTHLPKVPDEMIHNMIYENWKQFLPEYA
jgi:hypothetical protein